MRNIATSMPPALVPQGFQLFRAARNKAGQIATKRGTRPVWLHDRRRPSERTRLVVI